MLNKPLYYTKTELPLTDDSAIEKLVNEFESLTLPRQHWTHRAHLAVAIYYIRKLSFDEALPQLRERINAYNKVCGNPDGYHETITIMFLRKIAAESQHGYAPMHVDLARFEVICKVDWLYQYYSRDLIWSREARQRWIAPDLADLNF